MFLEEDITKFYLAEVLVAVESLHKKNILYRDLKPQNILLDGGGHIKLIDFGFSKQLSNLETDRTYTNCGTPGYCAPEVMLVSGYSSSADIWSFGILICEMLGGFIPFEDKEEAKDPVLIMHKCRAGLLNLPKNLNPVARDLVKSILIDDPVIRPTLEEIKLHRFFKGIEWDQIERRELKPPFIPSNHVFLEENEN